ncbi:MAG: ribose 5-phosphate isomerase B [Symbiobacteriaceae bacterium]|nr:ribose 5-phosphate isomerase B [Symbiobacteriaceae bacterium]
MPHQLLLAADHAGFALKEYLMEKLLGLGLAAKDLGCYDENPVDYPDFAIKLVEELLQIEGTRGILVCGTGIGMAMTANRYPGIRAALCHDSYTARQARAHNNSNILCLGGRIIGTALAEDITHTWLQTAFDGGRHQRRLDKITRP